MRGLFLLASALLLSTAVVAEWEFTAPVTISEQGSERFFHHLESSGRRNIAVSGDTVAVAWEDDRDDTPRIYLARKGMADTDFSPAMRVSGDGEAFEPTLVALTGERFALAWEEDAQVKMRIVSAHGMGPLIAVAEGESRQPSLHYGDGELRLVLAEQEGRLSRIYYHRFEVVGESGLKRSQRCAVDAVPPEDQQFYPTLARQQGLTVVAWEDRRPGHTVIMGAESVPGQACGFREPVRVSLPPEGAEAAAYGSGHGVARVALSSYGREGVYAAWADKRDYREGYSIFGAPWRVKQGFAANEVVQDAFGGVAKQWHATLAGDGHGRLVAAWSDERDGDSDVLLSWYRDGQWSDDLALPGGSGPGVQQHPSITLDNAGRLHVAWVERDEIGGPTRLRYTVSRWRSSN